MHKKIDPENMHYFKSEGLDQYFAAPEEVHYGAFDSIHPDNTVPYMLDVDDVVRLHQLIRRRKVLTIMEFGVGFSTTVMADALAKNQAEFSQEFAEQDIRCLHPFQIFSVEADRHWAEEAIRKVPEHLRERVHIQISDVYMSTFNDRFCHYYKNLPNITPDFIYLDGPAGPQVQGSIDGSDFAANYERTVLSGDLLRIEPSLVPGTMIITDGRVNNARFLQNNFQRHWNITEDPEWDVVIFELDEKPLGVFNRNKLKFHNITLHG